VKKYSIIVTALLLAPLAALHAAERTGVSFRATDADLQRLFDAEYKEIQRMRSVVQPRPGEQRSCIGCHESRLITPDQSYLKMQAMEKEPAEPTPPPWGAQV
jgi:hypothetical protein